MPEFGECCQCSEPLKVSSQECKYCGYNPGQESKREGLKMMAGGVILSITLVGAVLGIPLILLGGLTVLGASQLSPVEDDLHE